jgi:hypothetical protein
MTRHPIILPALALLACQAGAEPLLPQFDPADFPPEAVIHNALLPFVPGFRGEPASIGRDDEGELVKERTITTMAAPAQSSPGPGP